MATSILTLMSELSTLTRTQKEAFLKAVSLHNEEIRARLWVYRTMKAKGQVRLGRRDTARRMEEMKMWFAFARGKKPRRIMAQIPKSLLSRHGVKRLAALYDSAQSELQGRRKLTLKARRVKFLRNKEPDQLTNCLRRIKDGGMSVSDLTVRGHIEEQAAKNDWKWFTRLGKALEVWQNPKTRPSDFEEDRIDKVASFLVAFWFFGDKSLPALCYCTDRVLEIACRREFPDNQGISFDSVRQWRKRLGLRRPGPPPIKFLPKVDKK